ncbi:hypothetical protein [Helicobacter bilis]|uniref:hypothetical protein n=1 Tax=Helicobacter bilis TaxID=37372 RepID=UPI00248E1907|nr:hypothetical protein [Helicobacter bilis]
MEYAKLHTSQLSIQCKHINFSRLNSLTTPSRDIQGRDVILESRAFMDLAFNNTLSVGMHICRI